MTSELREALDRAHEGGHLLGVDVLRFHDDPNFVIAVRFRFAEVTVTFITVSDDDTVTAECGSVVFEDDGAWVDVSDRPVWSECIGGEVSWAWCLTNQQGYTDAVRIEFEMSAARGSRIVEFVVMASAFRFFESHEL